MSDAEHARAIEAVFLLGSAPAARLMADAVLTAPISCFRCDGAGRWKLPPDEVTHAVAAANLTPRHPGIAPVAVVVGEARCTLCAGTGRLSPRPPSSPAHIFDQATMRLPRRRV